MLGYVCHYIWFKDCTHDNWYHATMFSDIVSLCSKLINCSICDCFVNPNDADVILTAHNMEASLWPLQCPECFLGSLYIMTASAHGMPLITVMMRSHRYFPQSVNYWAQRTAMVPATMTMTIGKAVGMMVGQKNLLQHSSMHSFPNMIFLDWRYKIWRICLTDLDRCLRKIWKEREIHLAGRTVAAAHSHLTLLKHNCKDCI